MITVRRLTQRDALPYREIRLEAAGTCPDAFIDTHEDVAGWTVERFAGYLADTIVFGAFVVDRLTGVVAFDQHVLPPPGRKGQVAGMYVRPAGRGTGLSEALMHHVIAYARCRVERLYLVVNEDNDRARRLYERLGFRRFAAEPSTLKASGQSLTAQHMVLELWPTEPFSSYPGGAAAAQISTNRSHTIR